MASRTKLLTVPAKAASTRERNNRLRRKGVQTVGNESCIVKFDHRDTRVMDRGNQACRKVCTDTPDDGRMPKRIRDNIG